MSGFRKPGTRCQLCPCGMSPSFVRAVPSFGKMDTIPIARSARGSQKIIIIIMGDNCGSMEEDTRKESDDLSSNLMFS